MNIKRGKPWETAARKVAQLSDHLASLLIGPADYRIPESVSVPTGPEWQAGLQPGDRVEPSHRPESPWALQHRRCYLTRLGWSEESPSALTTWARDAGQTLACCLAIVACRPELARPPIDAWLVRQADPLWRDILRFGIGLVRGDEAIMAASATPWHHPGHSGWTSPVCPDSLWRLLRARAAEASQWFSAEPTRDEETSWFITHFFERFLAVHDPAARQHRGVYYTPREVVERMVADVNVLLRTEFGLTAGLADLSSWDTIRGLSGRVTSRSAPTGASAEYPPDIANTPFLHLLDPAAGSGAFLIEVIAEIARYYRTQVTDNERSTVKANVESTALVRDFDHYVAERLRRVRGFEIFLPACLVAQLNVAVKLEQLGFQFTRDFPLLVQPCDTLAGPRDSTCTAVPPASVAMGNDGSVAEEVGIPGNSVAGPFTIILGNPPFSGVSANESPWIQRLLRGREPSDPASRSYFQVNGQPLRERKVWLNDDYVKFFRHAQWLIDQAGVGLIAFVSNHGYLDNVTFRGMRQALLDSFPRITIVDLHGNRKRHEVTANGQPDFNLFSIAQGTAIGYFRRPPSSLTSSIQAHFSRHDLLGNEAEKRARLRASPIALESEHPREPVTPRPSGPLYTFTCTPDVGRQALPPGIPLNELMPGSSSVPVTARDHLVIAFTAEELLRKLTAFADPGRSDEDVRRKIFTRSRSRKYPAGDTRGWKLGEARQRLRQTTDWRPFIQSCLYRPWDERFIFWAEWMVDWPRNEFMHGWCSAHNWGLITRRQMLPNQPRNFIWASNRLVLDGVLRSDNRGNEYLFPLYRLPSMGTDASERENGGPSQLVANFASEPIRKLSSRWNLKWLPRGSGDLEATWGPDDLGFYVYGLLHGEIYQRAYATALACGFPPIVFPRAKQQLRAIRGLGAELVQCHLRLGNSASDGLEAGQSWTVFPRYPRYEEGRILAGPDRPIAEVDAATWEFRAGAHQVAAKWLADRRGHPLGPAERRTYQQVLDGITQTITLKQQLNASLDSPRRFELDFE